MQSRLVRPANPQMRIVVSHADVSSLIGGRSNVRLLLVLKTRLISQTIMDKVWYQPLAITRLVAPKDSVAISFDGLPLAELKKSRKKGQPRFMRRRVVRCQQRSYASELDFRFSAR